MKTSSDILCKKWQKLLEAEDLPAIKNHYRKAVTATILENSEAEFRAMGSQGSPQSLLESTPVNMAGSASNGTFPSNDNLKGYDPIMIALIRRSMPNLIAFDVCGVQPMTGPTGLIFAIKSKYTSQGGTEALFNEADTDFSGAGTHAGTAPLPQADANAYKPGTGMSTYAGEILGDGTAPDFAEMAFSIDKVSVTAKTRALKATYSMEIQQDLKSVHGIDAENELANILTNEILTEINREVIRTIYNNAVPGAAGATVAGVVDLDVDAGGRWAIEKFKGLMIRIEQDANAIAVATRRGRGNILMTSADVASALSIAGLLDCGSALKESLSHDGVVENTFVGVLNNRFKVFVDPYVASNAGYYVVGYKGQSAYDAGLFYCPYVPLTMVRAIDPRSFQPAIGFKSRYGMVANPFSNAAGNSDGTPTWNTNVYYRKVQVDNLL